MDRYLDSDAAVQDCLTAVIAGCVSGWTLPRAFYCDRAIFQLDLRRIFHRFWAFASHASQIQHSGDDLLVEIAGECLILLPDDAGEVRAPFNVCRHCGARICKESSGQFAGASHDDIRVHSTARET